MLECSPTVRGRGPYDGHLALEIALPGARNVVSEVLHSGLKICAHAGRSLPRSELAVAADQPSQLTSFRSQVVRRKGSPHYKNL